MAKALQWWPLVTIVVMIPVIAFATTRGGTPTNELNRPDHVFARDLAEQAREGAALAAAERGTVSRPLDRALADLATTETAQAAELRAVVGVPRQRTTPVSRRERTPPQLLRALRSHSEDDVLLARIELSSGHSPRLKRLAGDIVRSETARLRFIRGLKR